VRRLAMTGCVRSWLLIAPLALAACYSARQSESDAGTGRDAPDVDGGAMLDGAVDSGVGPPCDRPLSIPCIVPAGDGVLERRSPSYNEHHVQGLVITSAGAHVFYRRDTDAAAGTSVTLWETIAFDSEVRAGTITGLDMLGRDHGNGSVLRLSTDELHFAWRVSVINPTGMSIATETHEAQMAIGGGVMPLAPADRDALEDAAREPNIALAQTEDGALVTGRLTARGLALRSPTRETTLPFEMSSGNLQLAALSENRLVATVQEDSLSSSDLRRTAIVVGPSLDEQARVTVFDGPYSDDSLLVMGDDIYIARFELLYDGLDRSRLRIAHLDATLNRVEPDRALDGWGGLEPTYATLVEWQGRPWLVWRTIDVRYGANPVLYALPLTEEACTATVERPLVVFSDTSRVTSMRVAADHSALWVVTAPSDGPLLRAYRFAACR